MVFKSIIEIILQNSVTRHIEMIESLVHLSDINYRLGKESACSLKSVLE